MYFITIKQIKHYKSVYYIYRKSNTVVHIGSKKRYFCILMAFFKTYTPIFEHFSSLICNPKV